MRAAGRDALLFFALVVCALLAAAGHCAKTAREHTDTDAVLAVAHTLKPFLAPGATLHLQSRGGAADDPTRLVQLRYAMFPVLVERGVVSGDTVLVMDGQTPTPGVLQHADTLAHFVREHTYTLLHIR